MTTRFTFFLVCFFVVLYMIQAAEVGAKQEKSASETIDETIDKMKTGFNDFIQKVKDNEFVGNATKALEEFGDSVQAKGKELLNKFKSEH